MQVAQAIAYIRVSTQGQAKSGLGLEAQRNAINAFAKAEGFTVATTFEERETGKGSDALDRRPRSWRRLSKQRRRLVAQ
jgi:DNA invertase Pin-like site-specific DNA recombinase